MKYDDEEYTFKSGLKVAANCGIIGISPTLEVFEGYDGQFSLPSSESYDDYNNPVSTKSEKIELGEFMIKQWEKYLEEATK